MAGLHKLGRYTLGVGAGVFVLALVSSKPAGAALALAAGAVAVGWFLWGALALADEYKRGALFAAEVTIGAARLALAGPKAKAVGLANDTNDLDRALEQVPAQAGAPARWIVVNDKSGAHLMSAPGPLADERRRLLSFLALGERLGSFRFRDMRGRALASGGRVDWATWRALTDDLAGAGLFLKDKAAGARPIGGALAVMQRIERGAL